ncbi:MULTISPECIES: NERD domain-containing protein [unclassified Photobacterium]|uniref:NERD domain-containing protein n=1 Tax=unclassified Photobacterium TaxID=2628852 RepID=UPI000D1568A5|nr:MULTISPECIES: NERD domain-containing protein [unclassified Photobacterium]PSV29253.1 nuclease [Photobacterium sp. GB-72]PSV57357.1 nuclease [Photobacterium sp. GB-3]PSW73956.1 nuclease [Photobacterium sp. GB-50]
MDIFELLLSTAKQVWYLIPLILIVSLLKSSWFKGVFGEFLVNKLLSQLPKSDYTLIKDVTLPTSDGTTQIDHIVVSKFGIFVVETKNMKGWIFGSKSQKQWTQKIYRHSSKFQNPLHQNYKHVKTLESLLGIDLVNLHSVIVFIGDSTFKTKMPENVTYSRGCIHYIKQFSQQVFSESEYEKILDQLQNIKLKRGVITNIKHRQHVQQLVTLKSSIKCCSRCGAEMVLRETKRGANKGQQFWGCSTFPKCRSIQAVDTMNFK